MSGRIYRRPAGDILQPGRFTPAVVRGLKQKSREWSGQFQQEPHPASGIIFQPSWWKFYRPRDPLPDFDVVALSVDCAFKSAQQNDFVCLQKWGAVGARSYLLEMVTQRLGYAATKAMIRALQQDGYHASVVLIEDKANGSAIVEELRSDDFGASVIAINPEGGKESRAYAASADAEAGNVYLPEDADWLAGFLRTAAAFPAVKHDDQIDALTQFLNWRRQRNDNLGLVDLFKSGRAARFLAGLFRAPQRPKMDTSTSTTTPVILAAGQPVVATSRPKEERFMCPVCKSTATTRAAVAGGVHCNNCSTDFDMSGNIMSSPHQDGPCCSNFLPQVIANGVRCGNCGKAVVRTAAAVGSPRRSAYGVERWDRGAFGRFG